MTKTARNGIVAAAVVAVVAVAAAPFVVKGLKNQPDKAAESTTVAVTEQAQAFADPVEDTTVAIIDEILESMNQQTTQQSASAQQGTVAAQSQQTPAAQPAPTQPANTTAKPAATTKPATTAKSEATTKATTTKENKKFTLPTKAEKTTTAANSVEPGEDLNMNTVQKDLSSGGAFSYMWNEEGKFYYVDDNPWQRNFGFNAIYDWAAGTMVLYYDTWRACFDYDNLEWMIQAWKGQYGFLFIGCEIGVYTREPGEAVATSTHYNCADDNHLINMEMTMYFDAHDGQGYRKVFTRTYYPHWWATGFVDGHLADYKFNDRSCIIMIARLTMYDQEMLEAFTTALAGCGFRRVDSTDQISTSSTDTFTVVGNDVHFSWKTIDQGYNVR